MPDNNDKISSPMLLKIISGGQTGADQGALDAAISSGINHRAWLPKGRKTENGALPLSYRLKEMDSAHYSSRTRQNVLDSDGTLIISNGALTGGSALTRNLAQQQLRPCLHVNMSRKSVAVAANQIVKWMTHHHVCILNVAGPRSSSDARIYAVTRDVLKVVIKLMS